jgi:FMN phosphatase YigB (HAD superfamily)
MKPAIRHVCFDLDNTLVDDSGNFMRPAMRELLDSLAAHGITLSLWTASTRERALDVLQWHRLENRFSQCVFREDYDPAGEGLPKDISYLNADLLVDDLLAHIEFTRQKGKLGFLITPFLSPELPCPVEELEQLHTLILPGVGWYAPT